jgi:hypothetical protein
MLRAALSIALLCGAPAFAADNFAGTYTARNPQGNVVTLTLKQDAQGKVSGTLSGQGLTFKVEAEVRPEGLVGMLSGEGGTLFLISRLRGAELDVLLAEPGPTGQPNMQATRQFAMTRGAAKKPAAAAKPAAPEQEAVQFLTANPWCSFTYNQRSGTSTRERVVFRPDGTVSQQGGAETYSSGRNGTVAGQHASGNQGRWRVRGGQLELSADGAKWTAQPLEVTKNSNGYPIIKSGGKEYMVCQ